MMKCYCYKLYKEHITKQSLIEIFVLFWASIYTYTYTYPWGAEFKIFLDNFGIKLLLQLP